MVAALAGEQVLDLPLDRMDPIRFPNAEMIRDAAYLVLPRHHWTFEFQVLQLMGRPFRQSFSCGASAPDVMMPAPTWP